MIEQSVDKKFKYDEDEFLARVLEYIGNTYKQHYVGKKEIQTIDVWETLGSASTTTRDTAIKYLMRYGKKGGYNQMDLLKAIHYIVLLAYFTKTNDAAEQPKSAPVLLTEQSLND